MKPTDDIFGRLGDILRPDERPKTLIPPWLAREITAAGDKVPDYDTRIMFEVAAERGILIDESNA